MKIKKCSDRTLLLFQCLILLCFPVLLCNNSTPRANVIENPSQPLAATVIVDYNGIYKIDDNLEGDSQGDNDGKLDAGETVELQIKLRNSGDNLAQNIQGNISTFDSNTEILQNSQDFGNIEAGFLGINPLPYLLRINSSTPKNHGIEFNLTVQYLNETLELNLRNLTFSLTVVGIAELRFSSIQIISELDGDLPANVNDIIEPGEIIEFRLYTENIGEAFLYNASICLNESDPYVSIFDSTAYFGNIAPQERQYGVFGLIIAQNCPDKHNFTLNLHVIDGFNWKFTLSFGIVVNQTFTFTMLNIFYWKSYYTAYHSHVHPGESWGIGMNLKNLNIYDKLNLTAVLNCSSYYIHFQYPKRNMTLGNLNAGENRTYLPYNWLFYGSSFTMNKTIDFTVNLFEGEQFLWNYTFGVSFEGSPSIYARSVNFTEIAGDGDTLLEAGEKWQVHLTIENMGTGRSEPFSVRIANSYDTNYYYFSNSTVRYIFVQPLAVNTRITITDPSWQITIRPVNTDPYSNSAQAQMDVYFNGSDFSTSSYSSYGSNSVFFYVYDTNANYGLYPDDLTMVIVTLCVMGVIAVCCIFGINKFGKKKSPLTTTDKKPLYSTNELPKPNGIAGKDTASTVGSSGSEQAKVTEQPLNTRPIGKVCPSCKVSLPADALFCYECGHRLNP